MESNCWIDFFQVIQAVVAIVGLPILIWSVILLKRQTALSARATEANVYSNINARMIEIDLFFFNNPKLRPFFYDGVDITEENPDFGRAFSIAEMFVDFMDQVMVLRRNMPDFPWDVTWVKYFIELFMSSPVLRKYWQKHWSWYSAQIRGYYPENLRKLLECRIIQG